MQIMRYFKFIFILLFSALTSHLAIILFWPSTTAETPYKRMVSSLNVNKMALISENFGSDILQFESQDMRYAVCHYALDKQALIINSKIADSFAIITIYSEFGEALFSINTRQTKLLNVKLALLLEGAENNLPEGVVFHRIKNPKGMVVIRMAVPDTAYYQKIGEQLQTATCTTLNDVNDATEKTSE